MLFLDDPLEGSSGLDAKSILFPEVHLSCPIVRNQLRLICHIAETNPGFGLRDNGILVNYDTRNGPGSHRRLQSPTYQSAMKMKELIKKHLKGSGVVDSYRWHSKLIHAQDQTIGKDAEKLWKQTLHNMDFSSHKDNKYIDIALNQLHHIEAGDDNLSWQNVRHHIDRARYRESLNFWYMVRFWTRKVKMDNGAGGKEGCRMLVVKKGHNWDIFINGLWVAVFNKEKNIHCYLTTSQVLMYCDLVEGRWLSEIGGCLSPHLPSLLRDQRELLRIYDEAFEFGGTSTFEVVEQVEALLIGAIQNKDSCVTIRGEFLADTLVATQAGLEFMPDRRGELWIEELRELLADMDIEVAAELLCVFRLWGHPPVEAGPAADKMRQYMNAPAYTTLAMILKNRRAFRVMLINGYAKKNGGTWPNMTLCDRRCKNLSILRMTGKCIPLDSTEALADEIDALVFEDTFEVELENDYSIFFKDKAISPTVEYWDSVYQWVGMQYQPKQYTGHRRLLSYFLDDKNFDPYHYLAYIESGAYLVDPSINISTSLKEREVKLDGRLFAKMTPELRGGQVIAESLLSKSVLPLLSENGMVRTEREIAQQLISMNQLSSGESKGIEEFYNLACYLTTDIKKYCQSQRHEINAAIADDLNKLFGMKELFHWQHKVLLTHDVYVADPFCPPTNTKFCPLSDLDDRIKVKNCAGGIEGLSQKLWSIISITIIRDVAREMGCKIIAMVCGDNQVIAVTKRYPPSMHIVDARNDLVHVTREYQHKLATRLAFNNQLLKDRETVLSSDILVFGKRILRNGRYLPQSLKALTRMSLWAETTVEETRSACSNLATVICKALAQGLSPRLSYYVHAMRVTEQVLHGLHLTLNKGIKDISDDQILDMPAMLSALVRVPSPLGGFCYLLRDRLFVRNIGDPLSVSFADLKGLLKSGIINQRIFNRIFNQRPGRGSWLQLGLDPYSGNIQSTQSMTTILERITSGSVLSNSPNPLLKGLFHADFREEDELMAKQLLDTPEPTPRWAAAILKLLPTGKRKRIAGFVETMKTTIRQACKRGGLTVQLHDKLIHYDRDQFLTFINVLLDETRDEFVFPSCAVTLAEEFRNRTWAELLGGRKLRGLETPPIVEALHGRMLPDGDKCDVCAEGNNKYAWAHIDKHVSITDADRVYRKSVVPYMGSDTNERSQAALIKPYKPSAPVREAIRLAMLIVWKYGDTDEAWALAHKLACTRIPIDLELLRAVVPSPAAVNIHHRLDDGDTQISYFTGRDPRFARHIRLSTDNLNELLPGVDDTNLVYQPVMLVALAVIEDELKSTRRTEEDLTYHLHVNTRCCIRDMTHMQNEPVLTGMVPESIVQLQVNPLIYDPKGVRFHETTVIKLVKNDQTPKELARSQNDQTLRRELGLLTGLYVANGIISKSKARISGDVDTVDDSGIVVTGLISELAECDPRCFMISLMSNLLIDAASDLYFLRIFTKAGIIAWWTSRLTVSPNSLWLPLKSVMNSRKVLSNWLRNKMFTPQGSPNLYNVISIETIHGWLINTLRYILENPAKMKESLQIIDNKIEVIQHKMSVMRRNVWMVGTLLSQPCKLTRFAEMMDRDEDLHNQFCAKSSIAWVDEYPFDFEVTFKSGTPYYHARIVLSTLRERDDLSSDPEIEGLDFVGLESALLNPAIIYGDNTIVVGVDNDIVTRYVKVVVSKDVLDLKIDKSYQHYILRTVGFNTTAPLKVVHILENWKHTMKPKNILCTAEGSGGIACLAGLIWPQAKIWFNSLKMGVANDQRTDAYYPSEVYALDKRASESVLGRLRVIDGGTTKTTDLTENACVETILEEIAGGFDIITCDIENHDPLVLHRVWKNLLVICCDKLSPGGKLLFKLSYKIVTPFLYCVSWIRKFCINIKIHLSPVSGASSGEVYIEGTWNLTKKDMTTSAHLMADYYPQNDISPSEADLMTLIRRAEINRQQVRGRLIQAADKHLLTTFGGSICMDYGFRHNTQHTLENCANWFGAANRQESAIRMIMQEEKNDPRGVRLKGYGADVHTQIKSEIKEEAKRGMIELMLNADLRSFQIDPGVVLEDYAVRMDARLRDLVIKYNVMIPPLDNRTFKQVFKSWSGTEDKIERDILQNSGL